MCLTKSKSTNIHHFKIFKEQNEDIYTVYVKVGLRYRILCKNSDNAHIQANIEKYKKDPGSYTFRYKD